jgi:hypothetical protein
MGQSLRFGAILAACLTLFTPAASAAGGDALSLDVLSSGPQYVTGGDALVEVSLPARRPAALQVTLNGDDVTAAFHAEPGKPGRLIGLVKGLKEGANLIQAKDGARQASLTLTNYPISGPVFSGPHIEPFVCQTQDFLLPGGAKLPPSDDASTCAVPTQVQYLYLPKGESAFRPLPDTTTLPGDVATTVTTKGVHAPFVVRLETGVINRGIYQFAILADPRTEALANAAAPPKAWNRRLVSIQGAGCTGGWYIQGPVMGNTVVRTGGLRMEILDPIRLGQGYAIYGNTLQHPANSCNAVLGSEAAMMTQEHFVETFGRPVWTASHGCSGGSYASLQLADRLPGLYDGILIACTFPDALQIATEGQDSHLLTHYWAVTNPGGFTDAQKLAVSGYKTIKAFTDAANQAQRTDPVSGRADIEGYSPAVYSAAVPKALRYDPAANPKGARATIYDASRNIYGLDPRSGFARRTFDNVGVQYGLQALLAGAISKDQFLDLNARIGGYDNDLNYVAARSAGDINAIRNARVAGLQTSGAGGLASIPIVDVTGTYNDDAGYHYQWFHFAMRERLRLNNGDASNHVMLRGLPVPYDRTFDAFAAWLDKYKSDEGPGSQREKVIRAKTMTDGCYDQAGGFIAEPQTFSRRPDSRCNTLYPSFAATRLEAGGPLASYALKCQLKPVDAASYAPAAFTAAELDRLRTIFASGVCDWSKGDATGSTLRPFASFGPSPINRVVDPALPAS